MTEQDGAQGAARGRRWSWIEALVWLGVVGALLMVYAIRIPWARIQVATTQPGQGASTNTWAPVMIRQAILSLLSPQSGNRAFELSVEFLFLWGTALASGVILALAMACWRKSRLAATAYLVWLAVVTVGLALIAYSVFGLPLQAFCDLNCDYIVITARAPATGLWLNAGALALGWASGGARLGALRGKARVDAGRISLVGALRSLVSPARIGALAVTVGIAVWFFGYIFTPWATQGCTGFPVNWSHFVTGSCAGLDSDEVLVYATPAGFGNGSYLGLSVMGVLLAMLVALIAVWQRGWFPPLITAVWAALATWLTSLALSGLPALLKNPPGLSVSTAPWETGVGPAITQAGVVLVWVGVVAIYWGFAAEWRKGQRALAPNKSVSVR